MKFTGVLLAKTAVDLASHGLSHSHGLGTAQLSLFACRRSQIQIQGLHRADKNQIQVRNVAPSATYFLTMVQNPN